MYMNVHKTGFSAVFHISVMIFKLAHLIHLDLDHQNVFRQFHILFYQNQINSSIRSSGIRLSGIRLSGIRLSCIRLSGIRLSGIRLSGIRLSGTCLSGTRLSGIRLSGIRLSGIRLSGIWYPSFLPCHGPYQNRSLILMTDDFAKPYLGFMQYKVFAPNKHQIKRHFNSFQFIRLFVILLYIKSGVFFFQRQQTSQFKSQLL